MNDFRRYLMTSALFLAAPVPLALALTFLTGGWRDMLGSAAGTLAAALLYWWPVGAFLAWFKGRAWVRFVLGYLLALPLYFAALAVLYPAWAGARFHPFQMDRFFIYLSGSPSFYFMARVLYFFSTRAPRWSRRCAAAALAAGMILPFGVAAVANPSWPRQTGDRVVIVNARIVDAPFNRILEGENVSIDHGRIVEIGSGTAHPDWPRIDAHGAYLVPGLIDVHVHLQSPIEFSSAFNLKYFAESLLGEYSPQRLEYLSAGVTSVRDLGGSAQLSFRLRREIREKKALGPRLFAVGRLVTSPHGHPVSTIWPDSISREGAILAGDEPSLLNGLNRNYAEGPPDAVKFVHGTIGRAHEELSPALLARGVAWSAEHGLISVVHAETAAEVEDSIRAGATGVEHTAYLQAVPPELAALVAQRRPFLDPTFGEYAADLALRGTSGKDKSHCLDQSYESVRELARAGAKLVIGTDAPMVAFGAGLHEEFAHFARAGFTPAQILTFATQNNAAYLGKAQELGSIASGYRADLILVQNNPLQGLGALRHPVWTMLDGQIVAGREQ